jgi:hypothetical protein
VKAGGISFSDKRNFSPDLRGVFLEERDATLTPSFLPILYRRNFGYANEIALPYINRFGRGSRNGLDLLG